MFDLVPRDEVDLRLPSRGVPLAPAERRKISRAEALAMAVEDSRRNVQIRRICNLGEVGRVGMWTVSAVSQAAESEATKLPPERARVDAIADAIAAKTLNLIVEF